MKNPSTKAFLFTLGALFWTTIGTRDAQTAEASLVLISKEEGFKASAFGRVPRELVALEIFSYLNFKETLIFGNTCKDLYGHLPILLQNHDFKLKIPENITQKTIKKIMRTYYAKYIGGVDLSDITQNDQINSNFLKILEWIGGCLPTLPNITRLNLANNFFGNSGEKKKDKKFKEFIEKGFFQHIISLNLENTYMSSDTIQYLLSSKCLPSLRFLNLSHNVFPLPGDSNFPSLLIFTLELKNDDWMNLLHSSLKEINLTGVDIKHVDKGLWNEYFKDVAAPSSLSLMLENQEYVTKEHPEFKENLKKVFSYLTWMTTLDEARVKNEIPTTVLNPSPMAVARVFHKRNNPMTPKTIIRSLWDSFSFTGASLGFFDYGKI